VAVTVYTVTGKDIDRKLNIRHILNMFYITLSIYKKEIRISMRRARSNFFSSIESTVEASRLRRILAKSPESIGYRKTNADSFKENSQETLELLLDTHFP